MRFSFFKVAAVNERLRQKDGRFKKYDRDDPRRAPPKETAQENEHHGGRICQQIYERCKSEIALSEAEQRREPGFDRFGQKQAAHHVKR